MRQRSAALAVAYGGLGVTAAIVGPSLPALTERFRVGAPTLSLATTLLFSGLLIGVGLSVVMGRRGHRRVLISGAVVQSAALALVPLAAGAASFLVLAGLIGVGFGMCEVAGTVMVARGSRSAARLTNLTAVFAAAAITTPMLVSASLTATGSITPAYLVAAGVHAAAAVLTMSAAGDPRPGAQEARTIGPTGVGAPLGLITVLVSYVGAEATLATWSSELSRELLDLSSATAAAAATGFWICLLLGRLVAARLLDRVAPAALLARTLLVALITGALATMLDGAPALAVLALTVAAMGPVYGVALALAGEAPAYGVARRTGLLIALSAVGGAGVPAVVAPLATRGPTMAVLISTAFLGLAWLAAERSRQRMRVLGSPADARSAL